MLTPELITAILGVGGIAAILPKLIEGIQALNSGRAVTEKRKNQSILERLADSEVRAQAEADFRRALEEYAGALRLMLINAGIAPHRIPPWPVRKTPEKR